MAYRERMRDSAYAQNIPASWRGIVAGYLAGGDAFHPWSAADWQRFRGNPKLPIFVRSNPLAADPVADAFACLRALYLAGAPGGCLAVLDIESARAPVYVAAFGKVMAWAGHRVWVYGSRSTLFSNPALYGRWVAQWAGTGPSMMADKSVRATQYADPSSGSGGPWDSSTVRWWQQLYAPWWR